MEDDSITISNGDRITVAKDSDGESSIRIENAAFVEPPRWLRIAVAGKHDRARAIDDLIHALEQLRDGE